MSLPLPLVLATQNSDKAREITEIFVVRVNAPLVAHSLDVLETDAPRLVHYGISDEQAFTVGLACGGIIDVYIEPIEALK